jgi:hypothetical protein
VQNTCKHESGSTQLGKPIRGRFHNKPRHCPLSLSSQSVTHPRPRCSTKTSRRRPYGSATAPSSSEPNTCKQESGSTQLGVPTRGAASPQTSPLPYECLSYPSPSQDPVAPPKQVVVGRTVALRLRLLPCLTPASKNQVQPSLGCRQGGRFHLKPRHCPLTLSRTRHLPKTPLLYRNESSSAVRQRYGSVFFRA